MKAGPDKPVYAKYVEVFAQDGARQSKSCLVALYKGIDADELHDALEAVFRRGQDRDSAKIVALEDVDNNVLISLNLACAEPELLNGARYKLLMEHGSNRAMAANGVVKAEMQSPGPSPSPSPSRSMGARDERRVLSGTIEVMYRIGMLSQKGLAALRQLIGAGDPSLSAAYQVYLEDNNKEELMDTLRRLSMLALAEIGVEEDYGDMGLTNVELIEIVSRLENSSKLSEEECIVLGRLSEMEHALVKAACEVYLQDGDEVDLADTLKRVSKHLSITRITEALLAKELISEDQFDQLNELFFAGDQSILEAWSTYCLQRDEESFIDFLLELLASNDPFVFVKAVCEDLDFSKVQTEAILKLLEANDETVLAALDVYNLDHDVDEVGDTLLRIANMHLSGEKNAKAQAQTDGTKKEEKLLLLLRRLEKNGKIPKEIHDKVRHALSAGDQRAVAAYDTFLSTGDQDDFIDTINRIVKMEEAAAEGTDQDIKILALIMKQIEAEVFTAEQGSFFGDLLEVGDHRLLAAFDVYDDEQNLEDLNDTLKRIYAMDTDIDEDCVSSATYDEDEFLDDDSDDDSDEEDLEDLDNDEDDILFTSNNGTVTHAE